MDLSLYSQCDIPEARSLVQRTLKPLCLLLGTEADPKKGQVAVFTPASGDQYSEFVTRCALDRQFSKTWIEFVPTSDGRYARTCLPFIVDSSDCSNAKQTAGRLVDIVKSFTSTVHDASGRVCKPDVFICEYPDESRDAFAAVFPPPSLPRGTRLQDMKLYTLQVPRVFLDQTTLLHIIATMPDVSGVHWWLTVLSIGVAHPVWSAATNSYRFVSRLRTGRPAVEKWAARPVIVQQNSVMFASSLEAGVADADNDIHCKARLDLSQIVRVRKLALANRHCTIVATSWQPVEQIPDVAFAVNDWLASCGMFQQHGAQVTRFKASVSPQSGYLINIALQLDHRVCLNIDSGCHDSGDNSVLRIDRSGAWIQCRSREDTPTTNWAPDAAFEDIVACQTFSRKNEQRVRLSLIRDKLQDRGMLLNSAGLLDPPTRVKLLLGLSLSTASDARHVESCALDPHAVEIPAEGSRLFQKAVVAAVSTTGFQRSPTIDGFGDRNVLIRQVGDRNRAMLADKIDCRTNGSRYARMLRQSLVTERSNKQPQWRIRPISSIDLGGQFDPDEASPPVQRSPTLPQPPAEDTRPRQSRSNRHKTFTSVAGISGFGDEMTKLFGDDGDSATQPDTDRFHLKRKAATTLLSDYPCEAHFGAPLLNFFIQPQIPVVSLAHNVVPRSHWVSPAP